MERKMRKKLLAILMIITILAADFFVLGSNLITYATQLNSETNNTYVEFVAYFKDGENRVDSIQSSIKNQELKLYAEIKVKNEGYLKEGTVITIENSNFNIKEEILETNTHIASIEENQVALKQINSGETVELELGIEPVNADKITTDFLSKASTVKILGTYIYSQAEDGESIQAEKTVCVNYQPDETANAELETNIITNKVISVSGTNQRIVQLLVKSRLAENQYPVKETTLNVSIPQLSETTPEVSVLATNGTTKISGVTSENGTTQITIKNEADENNQIDWNKNNYYEIVVTYKYPETVDASKIEITTNSEIKLYNLENKYTATKTVGIENQELNSVVIGKTEITTEEMYKGQLYANIDTYYNTTTTIAVTMQGTEQNVIIKEGQDSLLDAESKEITTNTKYITTEINREKMLAILGQDGSIEIKNGETTTVINKDTQVDANGNVVISHGDASTSELIITTSAPTAVGIIEINHTKVITGNGSTRQQLQTAKTLKAKGTVTSTNIVENSTETSNSQLELKETITKAELTIDKTALSATEANEVTVGIKLITDGVQYDLYKNPSIALQMPAAVKNVEFMEEPSKLYADEFGTISQTYNATNKVVTINMTGEQTTYPESSLQQPYIQLKLKITLDELVMSQTDKITMGYKNENAIQYDNGETYGIVEKAIQISAPSELVKMFNISSNENTSTTETILQKVKETDAGKEFTFDIQLINNNDSHMSNVKIFGKLPTTGNTITEQEQNTLETILKSVVAQNGTIYYTENANATIDVEDTTNGWTTDLTTLTNAKLYLIKIESIARGERFAATVTIQIPNPITENGLSYTEYEVIYDTDTSIGKVDFSRKIGLISSMAASISVETTAQVGQDVLKNGDTVKEGEVIKYTVTVENNGVETLQNVQLNLDVPEGTVYVSGETELTTITIPELTTTQAYTAEYKVRVNKGTANTEISNETTAKYEDSTIRTVELKNVIQEANVRVGIKNTTPPEFRILPNSYLWYKIEVENLTDSTINNIELEINSENFVIKEINSEKAISNKIQISEIEANGISTYEISGRVEKYVEEMSVCAIANDENGVKYRSELRTKTIPYVDAIINMTSPQNGKYIKEGDTVEYNITIKNTSSIEGVITLYDMIPEYLQVQSIYKNNVQDIVEINSKYMVYEIELQPQEQTQVKIIAKVLYIPEMHHGKTITNMVTISVIDAIDINSQIITHILKSSEMLNDNVENVISGSVWFDENGNGQRDDLENTISGVKVKLYNTLTKKYITDEYFEEIKLITDEKGEYNFSKIEDGSYLVVFEYDTEKYVLTTRNAEGVDTSLNSKAEIKNTITERVAAIELSNLQGNALNMNIGLKENTGDTPEEEQPGAIETPINPENPEDPENPGQTEKPENPENPTNPDNSEDTESKKTISGLAWLDSNRDGQKDENEKLLSGIKVKVYDVETKNYLKDNNGNIVQTETDNNGKYTFSDIEKGLYILIFEYNTEEYEPTKYMAEGVATTKNSKAIMNQININGQEMTIAVTDTINVQNNVSNINIGLKEKLVFDLELNKYISRIVVQNSKETKAYDYDEKELAKVEIHKKRIEGSLVVIEYTIKVKNRGEISGYAKNIVDYLPSGLTFSSELNSDWYLMDNNLYTKSLGNIELKPGEEKEVKLILTKTMTKENVGLINNRAEIYEDYNQYGENDIDSTPNNQNQSEDDMSSVDVIIGISTGGRNIAYMMLLMINLVLIIIAIRLMIKNDIIKISTKRERR